MRFRSTTAMLARLGTASLMASLSALGCSSNDPTQAETPDAGRPDVVLPVSCPVDAPTACPEPAPKYTTDIEPIIGSRCVLCHNGTPGGPWSLQDYKHVVDWTDSIRGELLACSMPPPDAAVPITKEERLAILTWIRCGTPR